MNFPPIVFNDPKFSSLITRSHQNQQISSLIESQNLLKKLSKFETKENNFQSNVINWLKTSNKNQLIKYFSINSQWFVHILREMAIIAKYRPNSKFIFNPPIKTIKNIYDDDLPFFYLFDNNNKEKYKPNYEDYFTLYEKSEEGFIDLGKKIDKENIQIKFLKKIRYLTLSKSHNNGKKYFFDYNNVVTLALEFLMNIEKLIDVMMDISKNEIFKYPIKIESQPTENGNKYLYNIKNSNWLNSPFTLTELLCSYFEQSVLLNYEYYLLNNKDISGLYYDKLDEYIENIFKLVEFIGNANEKKVEIFQCIHADEINKNINDKEIQNIIDDKKRASDYFHSLHNPNFKLISNSPKSKLISSILMTLQSLFIKGDLKFVTYMTFIKNSTIFTTEDFIIKTVYDIINNFWKSKMVEDLLKDFSSNKTNENNNSNHKKRKKKRKKKNNKTEERKEVKDDDINIDIDKIINNPEENKEIEENLKDEKIIKIDEENKEVVTVGYILDNQEKKNVDSNNDIHYMDKQQTEIKEEFLNEVSKEEDEDTRKTEKNFFLYPVVKNKKRKNKNKKKEKKHVNNNKIPSNSNNINNTNEKYINNSPKSLSTKTNSITNNEIISDNFNKNEIQNLIYLSNNNEQETINTIKSKNENINILPPPKHINKFNINKNKLSEEDLEQKSNGNNGYFNPNRRESNLSRIKQDDKYCLEGSNCPRYTSFYFKSRKKKNRKDSDQTQFSFRANNILEFSKEIVENTQKVNINKEILQKIREKYIKKIYENINIILKNEKVNFLCSFYGSNISGLSIENSDIDIMVKIRKNQNEINYINRLMDIIAQRLKDNYQGLNYIKNIHPIYTASVPVIKLECDLSSDSYLILDTNNLMKNYNLSYNNLTKLFFDITFFEVDNEEDKIPSELMLEYIKQTTKIYPQIFDIIYIMKKFLSHRKLNQSYQGGISSFSLFLLILAFVKYFTKNNSEIPIGSLLIELLRFYSNFDFYNFIIRPDKSDINEIYIMNESTNHFFNYNINIVDPITGFNVAKSTFKIEEIKKAFKDGLDIILGNLYKININQDNMNVKEHLNNDKILEHFFFDK